MDIEELYEQAAADRDSSAQVARMLGDDAINDVAGLVRLQQQYQRELAEAEEKLSIAQRNLDDVRFKRLPAALEAKGVSKIVLTDGSTVEVEDKVHCAITEQNRPAALTWLRSTGNDGIIKNEYKLDFGKGQGQAAGKFRELLEKLGLSYSNKEYVHHSTLGAFVRKQLKDGSDIPTEIFSIHTVREALIRKEEK
jgi:hypothetical protein